MLQQWSSSQSPPDVSWTPFSSSLTTTVFSQRSMRRFEASPRRAAPKGQPSSLVQHRIKNPYLHVGLLSAFVTHNVGRFQGSRAAVPSSGRRCSIGFERSATSRARMCLPRSLPTSSPRRRGQRGARAAQRARTTLTLTSGDARSAARKALAGPARSTPGDRCSAELPRPVKEPAQNGYKPQSCRSSPKPLPQKEKPSSNPFGDPHSCRKTPLYGHLECVRRADVLCRGRGSQTWRGRVSFAWNTTVQPARLRVPGGQTVGTSGRILHDDPV